MLQLQQLRQDPQGVKNKLGVKYFAEPGLVDEIIALDDQRKKLQLEFDTNKSQVNSISKEIGQLMAKGQKEEAEAKKQAVAGLNASLQPIAEKL
ncbi:MAG TPA: serine--tRNA ligase, partial [Chitinophagaceae bacterium]|nr:serine--tRNA ligase [Chitinophagaceae bacterium]